MPSHHPPLSQDTLLSRALTHTRTYQSRQETCTGLLAETTSQSSSKNRSPSLHLPQSASPELQLVTNVPTGRTIADSTLSSRTCSSHWISARSNLQLTRLRTSSLVSTQLSHRQPNLTSVQISSLSQSRWRCFSQALRNPRF